jgi:crotonobetainyl-CoA:carnitine CoA-transferase CaiB-like acyl-CoA transferase
MTKNTPRGGPLDGVRVLDLTAIVSGPVATMMLGDQGADVIKIEPPQGDLMRQFGVKHRGMSASFLSCNRSKRSLCVDLKTDAGIEIVKKLAATADVLVQNFRPGAIERMGLGEETVRALRPNIIFVSISGFGESGPYAHQRVYDPVIQALCGLADIQADQDSGRPRMIRTIVPDKTTAVTAAQAITAALFARERTGEGQHVRLSMLDTMVAYLWPEASSSLSFVGNERDPAQGQMGPRPDLSNAGWLPHHRRPFRCRMGRDVPRLRARRVDRGRTIQNRDGAWRERC